MTDWQYWLECVVIGAFVLLMMFFLATWPAQAHDLAAMTDQKRGEWFNSLKTPTGGSCCNLTDCREVEARQMPDQSWEAKIEGRWTPIPPEKVLTNPKSIDGEAYLCRSNYVPPPPTLPTIYCFVPPVPGY